jgi:hypothetical protein
MGKSFICWALALMSYSLGRRVLYVGDASEWMTLDIQHRPRYLINLFLSLNRDILPASIIDDLEHPAASWDHLSLVLYDPKQPTVVIIDEHSAVVPEYEKFRSNVPSHASHSWLSSFILLNTWESAFNTVVLFSGSSHGAFELQYMKNGMQEYKRFVTPMRQQEAEAVLQLEAARLRYPCPPRLVSQVLVVTNCVPRELSHFVQFAHHFTPAASAAASGTRAPATVASSASAVSASSSERARPRPSQSVVANDALIEEFITWRRNQIELEASKYFQSLSEDMLRTWYLRSLTALFARSSLPDKPGDTAGFFDLGLCYRYFGAGRLVLRPLCFAATSALLRLYHEQAVKYSPLLRLLASKSLADLKGEDFEDLMWHYITACCGVVGDGQDIPCYYLNGTPAAPLRFGWEDFYTLDSDEDFPPVVLRDRNILYRCRPAFPRWDFIAPNMLIQVSKSEFSEHNRESADIRRSFDDNAQELVDILDALHCGRHSYKPQQPPASSGKKGKKKKKKNNHEEKEAEGGPQIFTSTFQRDGQDVPFSLVYVTLHKPNHPRLFQSFPDVRVVAAEDILGSLQVSLSH